MTRYEKKLVELAKELQTYRETTDCKDYTFLSKIDFLIGYCLAPEEIDTTKDWRKIFKEFHNKNENGGSSRWLVAPNIVETFIAGLLGESDE